MSKKKKISIKQRLTNTYSWIRHPQMLVEFSAFFALFLTTLHFIAPCGKHGLVVNGVCDNGETIGMGLDWLLGGFITFTVLSLVYAFVSGEKNEAQWLTPSIWKSTLEGMRKAPKWRKRWFPWIFIVVYASLCVAGYYLQIDTGLPWYYYVVQYAVILPLFVIGITVAILDKFADTFRPRMYTSRKKAKAKNAK